MNITKKTLGAFFLAVAACFVTSCEDTKSYSELLNDEEHAVNWFLAQHKVELELPKDGKFIVGENAPYYKMDKEGSVYMQVLNAGTDIKPEKGDRVYFRFMRMNIQYKMSYNLEDWTGNSEDFGASSSTSLIYGNNVLSSTTQYGEGIQVPLQYLGYDSEVNLIVKSTEGFTDEISSCIPYLFNIRYFKAEY